MTQRSWKKRRAALFADAQPSPTRQRRRAIGGEGLRRGMRLPRRVRAQVARAAASPAIPNAPVGAGGIPWVKRLGRSVPWLGLATGLVLAGLGLAALRTELVRLQYELGRVAAQEAELREQLAESAATARVLRDPRRLRELAQQRGFVPPERVIDLRPGKRQP
jgi:hypothetical protein